MSDHGPRTTRSPECGDEIVACDNGVYLDYPAVPFDSFEAQWTILNLGAQSWAAAGQASAEGLGHTLHEHQPPEASDE